MTVLRRYYKKTEAEITALHTWGWEMETALQAILEGDLNESIQKTKRRFDAVDFLGTTVQAEVKCRRRIDKKGRTILSSTYDDWLVPLSKIRAAERSSLRTAIYYYFEGDGRLFKLWADEIDWDTIKCETPWFHTDKHYYVPANLWTEVDACPGFDFPDSNPELSASGDSCSEDATDAVPV